MKILCPILGFLLFVINLAGQEVIIPPKMIIEDPELKSFLTKLENAVKVRDKAFIIENMDPQITNSFGGDGGIEEFKQYWNWDSDSSEFWDLMKHLFKLGGDDFTSGDMYAIPYVFSGWPGHEKYDVFDHMAVTGSRVNVRDKPSLKNSNVLGQMSYDIVKVNYEKSYPPFDAPRLENVSYVGNKLWYYIESLDGKLKGYVFWEFIWSPIDYRLGIEKKNGKWVITFFVAGD